MHICITCGQKTRNPKFCSRSCAAKLNNHLYPRKHKLEVLCTICGINIARRRLYCDNCNPNIVDWNTITLGETRDKRFYQKSSRIRTLAREKFIQAGRPLICSICKYDKHTDVCHIKAVNTFSNEATIAEINSQDNLIALCKNHHWEFDNGYLKIEDILSN
jgi:hypothetical protein